MGCRALSIHRCRRAAFQLPTPAPRRPRGVAARPDSDDWLGSLALAARVPVGDEVLNFLKNTIYESIEVSSHSRRGIGLKVAPSVLVDKTHCSDRRARRYGAKLCDFASGKRSFDRRELVVLVFAQSRCRANLGLGPITHNRDTRQSGRRAPSKYTRVRGRPSRPFWRNLRCPPLVWRTTFVQ